MKRRQLLLSGTASAALALTGCGGGGSDTAATGGDSTAATSGSAATPRRQIAAATGGVAYPFGARPAAYVAGIKPSQANATMDNVLGAQYDAWKRTRAVPVSWIVPGGYAVQFSDASYLAVSEGTGYGMLLAVLFAGHDPNAQQLFDGLLAVARTRYAYAVAQYEPGGKYLMDWKLWSNGTSAGGGWSACDGDLDIAMALLMADRQWGSFSGSWNYKQEALNTIAALKAWNFDAATGAVGGRGVQYAGSARISDYMTGHFRAFKAATGDGFWDLAISKNLANMEYLQTVYSGGVGLVPDWAVNVNGGAPSPSPGYIGDNSPYEGYYWWNACRNPWRLATDYVLSGDVRTKTICARIVQFFKNQVDWAGGDVTVIGTGYALNGTKVTGGNSPAYHGPIMLGACIDPAYQGFLDAMWNWNAGHLTTGYYDSEIQLLSMAVASGNWWTPATAGASTATAASQPQAAPAQQAAAQATGVAIGANLLTNGDFSNGLANWNNWGNAWVTAGVLQVGTAAGGVAQDIASKLSPGTSYHVTALANVSAAAEGVYIGVKLMDSAGNVLVNQLQTASTTTASTVTLSFTAPQGAVSGYVFVWKNASGALGIVDNVTLSAAGAGASATATAPAAPAAAANNLLVNGNFASGMGNWNNWGNAWVAGGTVQVGTAAGGVSQDVASKLTPGANYKLTGTANVSGASEGVFVGVRLFDAWGGMLVNQTQLVSSTAASGVSVSFTAPAGAASGYVFVWKNASNAVAIVGNLSLGAA